MRADAGGRGDTLLFSSGFSPLALRREVRYDDLARDVQHAYRTLWRAPGFGMVAILSLALGVGCRSDARHSRWGDARTGKTAWSFASMMSTASLCNVPATTVTVGRVAPSIIATNSCVGGNTSEPMRSAFFPKPCLPDDLAAGLHRVLNREIKRAV